MRVDLTFFWVFTFHSVKCCIKTDHCLLDDLNLPEHFDKWDCSEPIAHLLVFIFALT